ncbi:hypothetical protein [Clostridium pasteurianum]|uniref:hypothetical protein n=1 Tax=Clostridium pasteurianum TaxID=1501 RepID=UPI003D6CDFED
MVILAKIKDIKIVCTHCGTKIPSPIFFGDTQSLATSTMTGNTMTCPTCGRPTGCNKENMLVVTEEGTIKGSEIH